MREDKPGRSLARYIVIGVAVFFYVAAGVVYLIWAPDFPSLWIVGVLAAIATIYLGIFLLGSEKACENSLIFLARIL